MIIEMNMKSYILILVNRREPDQKATALSFGTTITAWPKSSAVFLVGPRVDIIEIVKNQRS